MQHEHQHVPVTALAFSGQHHLLAGEGNYLCIYNRSTHRLLTKVQAFDRQAIHGILAGEDATLLWGGHSLRYFRIEDRDPESIHLKLGAVNSTGDWILNASFAPASAIAAIVTAHNALWLTTTSDDSPLAPHMRLLVPGANSILYSAHTTWLSPSHCLVASGTAFGDVTVWSAFLPTDREDTGTRTQIHYSFSAHRGSIFGVRISPSLCLPGGKDGVRVLASCSDDRCIKLWDISVLSSSKPAIIEERGRETGFGGQGEAMDGDVAPRCLAQVMGHASRIWHVRFDVPDLSLTLKSIRSFGEDASVITWDLVEAGEGLEVPYVLQQLDTKTPHAGKNIWSVAVSESGRVATGGADGSSATHPISRGKDTVNEVSQGLIRGSDVEDALRAYCYVSTDVLVATTDRGRVVLLDGTLHNDPQISTVEEAVPGLRGYSIVAGVPGFGFIAGTDGGVHCYSHCLRELRKILQLGRKTAGLFCCEVDENTVALVVASVGESEAVMLSFDRRDVTNTTTDIRLALPPGFVATSFATVKSDGLPCYAVLGSRKGSIALFNINDKAYVAPEAESSTMFELVHSNETITSITTTTNQSNSPLTYLFSTGRDGTFAIHRFSTNSNNKLSLHLLHQLSLPFGPNIEGLSLSPSGDLQIWGFRSKHFIVYSLSTQREIMAVDCGGAHRHWAFQPREDGKGGMFVWTKASKVYCESQTSLPYQTLNGGGHGREIKAMAVSPVIDGREQLIATGAEDTDIKISTFSQDRGRGSNCLQTLRKHNTGIQHLQWSADGRYLCSSGGFEEFFVWRMSFDVPGVGIGVVCESVHPRSGMSDVRIMGFAAVEIGTGGFEVVMAYSDSMVKMWRYQDKGWEVLKAGDYLTACLTDVIVLPTQNTEAFLTTATDGHLIQWHSAPASTQQQKQLSWTRRHRVHQSAIHAVAIYAFPASSSPSHLIVTGGDDNAIGITRITAAAANESDSEFTSLRLPRAHAAAVTGLAVFDSPDKGRFWLVSVGIDQYVKLWEVRVDLGRVGVEGVEVKLVWEGFTAVADVSGVEVCERGEGGGVGVVICGVGVDMWRVSAGDGV